MGTSVETRTVEESESQKRLLVWLIAAVVVRTAVVTVFAISNGGPSQEELNCGANGGDDYWSEISQTCVVIN